MKTNLKEVFLFWSILLISISILFIIQTSFWPEILSKRHFVPQISLPLVIYFFSQKDMQSSLVLTFFISLISYNFSVTPLPHLLISYFIICMLTQIIYRFYFGNKKSLFFILLFIGGFIFPILIQTLSYLNKMTSYFSINFFNIFSHSLTTLLCGFLLYPFLKKYITKASSGLS